MEGKQYDLAIVIHSLKVGGSEKFVLSLTNRFSERGFDVLLILLESENPMLDNLDKRADFIILSRSFKYDLSISFKIKKILGKKKINKVLCVEPYAFFLTKTGVLFSSLKPAVYLSLHHSKPIRWKKRLMDILFLKTLSNEDLVIFICRFQQSCFSSSYYFSPISAKVIYNGIDVEYFSPHRTISDISGKKLSWRFRLGIKEHEPAIITVGRLSPEKGHKYAIDALDHLLRMHNIKAHLIFIGDGSAELRGELTALAKKLDVIHQLHFEGIQYDVRPYLFSGDLFTLTSVSETFSLAALEAMSMGMPCSLTDVGGARELIVDDKLGDLCKPEDAVSIACSWAKVLSQKNDRDYIRNWIVTHYGEQHMIGDYIHTMGLNNKYCETQEIF